MQKVPVTVLPKPRPPMGPSLTLPQQDLHTTMRHLRHKDDSEYYPVNLSIGVIAVHCLAPAIATVNVYRLWLLQMSVLHVVPCSLRAYCMYSLIILAVVNGHTCTDFSLW